MAIDSKNLLVWVKAMSRGQALPLDSTEIWDSFESAQDYAANNATAYVGQTLKVVTDKTVESYIIGKDKTLIKNIDANYSYDDRYYTESEVDSKIDAALGGITTITDAEIEQLCASLGGES